MYIGIGIDLQEPPEVRENALVLIEIHVLVETFIRLSVVEGHRVDADTTFGFANLDNTVYVGEIFVQGHNFSVRPSCTAQHCVRAAKTDICGTGTARHGQL